MARILLIEPDTILAKLYDSALTHEGHEVVITPSASEAIAEMDAQAFQVVVLELQLPLHNGLEFLYELRSYVDWQKVPVIIHSFVNPDSIQRSLTYKHLGVASYLHKDSARIVDLLQTVRQVTA